MTTPDELQRAVERLTTDAETWPLNPASSVAGRPAQELAADLRLLLSQRAELLATVERMRGQVFSVGDLLSYDMGGTLIRCTYRGDCEGWPLVSFDADGPDAVAIPVRPSRVKARATLTTGEATTPNAGEKK